MVGQKPYLKKYYCNSRELLTPVSQNDVHMSELGSFGRRIWSGGQRGYCIPGRGQWRPWPGCGCGEKRWTSAVLSSFYVQQKLPHFLIFQTSIFSCHFLVGFAQSCSVFCFCHVHVIWPCFSLILGILAFLVILCPENSLCVLVEIILISHW